MASVPAFVALEWQNELPYRAHDQSAAGPHGNYVAMPARPGALPGPPTDDSLPTLSRALPCDHAFWFWPAWPLDGFSP